MKTYTINGKEIKFDGGGVVQLLLEALDEKKEEPKSTLREEIKYLVTHTGPTTQDSLLRVTDQIISLFKDTLLKEVKKAEPLRLQGESTDFTQGQEWTMTQIKQIIKNI